MTDVRAPADHDRLTKRAAALRLGALRTRAEHMQFADLIRKEGLRIGKVGETSVHSGYPFGVVLRPRGVAQGEIDETRHPKFFIKPDGDGANPLNYVDYARQQPLFVYAKRARDLHPFILMAERLCSRGVWVTAV